MANKLQKGACYKCDTATQLEYRDFLDLKTASGIYVTKTTLEVI